MKSKTYKQQLVTWLHFERNESRFHLAYSRPNEYEALSRIPLLELTVIEMLKRITLFCAVRNVIPIFTGCGI
jgi:hypothetical protein